MHTEPELPFFRLQILLITKNLIVSSNIFFLQKLAFCRNFNNFLATLHYYFCFLLQEQECTYCKNICMHVQLIEKKIISRKSG